MSWFDKLKRRKPEPVKVELTDEELLAKATKFIEEHSADTPAFVVEEVPEIEVEEIHNFDGLDSREVMTMLRFMEEHENHKLAEEQRKQAEEFDINLLHKRIK